MSLISENDRHLQTSKGKQTANGLRQTCLPKHLLQQHNTKLYEIRLFEFKFIEP